MTIIQIPTPKDIVALLAQDGVLTVDKEAFAKAFKTLYPTLSATERAGLLAEVLAYIDSTLEAGNLPAAA